jgi:hypothetical protein
MKLVPLWTDVLVWLLVAVVASYAWYARRHPHLVAPWRRVARASAGMASLVIVGLFAVIGLADSVHYRPLLPETAARSITGQFGVCVRPWHEHADSHTSLGGCGQAVDK